MSNDKGVHYQICTVYAQTLCANNVNKYFCVAV